MADLEYLLRTAFYGERNSVSMRRRQSNGLKNQQVQGALKEIETLIRAFGRQATNINRLWSNVKGGASPQLS